MCAGWIENVLFSYVFRVLPLFVTQSDTVNTGSPRGSLPKSIELPHEFNSHVLLATPKQALLSMVQHIELRGRCR